LRPSDTYGSRPQFPRFVGKGNFAAAGSREVALFNRMRRPAQTLNVSAWPARRSSEKGLSPVADD
jgi:hypothetical protein